MSPSYSAFVTGAAPLSLTSTAFTTSLTSARPMRARVATPARVTAILGTKKVKGETAETIEAMDLSRTEKNRRIKDLAVDTDPQGFTDYSENVNGRLAQMFFVIGLITEIASGKPMSEQILIMFSPFVKLAELIVFYVQQTASTY